MTDDAFTIDGARDAAGREQLDQWVTDFLSSPGSDNAELGEQLQATHTGWLGPVEIPIDELHRLAGPPGHPVLEEVEEHEWRDDIDDLAGQVAEEGADDVAPVIATYRDGQFALEDGNHRVEAFRRAGHDTAWTVVGFAHEEERTRFLDHFRAAIEASTRDPR